MKNIFIKTFGCSLNRSDSEVMAGLLEKEGNKIAENESKADLVIINTCNTITYKISFSSYFIYPKKAI